MAYSRLLLPLLMIGLIFPHRPQVHTRSIDIWCRNDTRKKMIERIDDKLQQKYMEVLQTLQQFLGGVQGVKSEATIQCQTSKLKRLERSITNYLAIVNNLHIQIEDFTTPQPAVQSCSNRTSLNQVLTEYRRFLSGKLERLAVDIQRSLLCEETQASE